MMRRTAAIEREIGGDVLSFSVREWLDADDAVPLANDLPLPRTWPVKGRADPDRRRTDS
jgi:hypothetical protein